MPGICSLVVKVAEFNYEDPSSLPERAVHTSACQLQCCDVFVKDQ